MNEPGISQDDEKDHQYEMLRTHPDREPHRLRAGPGGPEMGAEFLRKVEEVVHRHAADGGNNERDVHPGNEVHQPRFAFRRTGWGVDFEKLRAHTGADAGMTLAASLRQIFRVDR